MIRFALENSSYDLGIFQADPEGADLEVSSTGQKCDGPQDRDQDDRVSILPMDKWRGSLDSTSVGKLLEEFCRRFCRRSYPTSNPWFIPLVSMELQVCCFPDQSIPCARLQQDELRTCNRPQLPWEVSAFWREHALQEDHQVQGEQLL